LHSKSGSPVVQEKDAKLYGLFIANLVGVLIYVVLDGIAQSLPPHYSPIRQAESDLAVGPFGLIMTINFVNRGALSLAFLYAFEIIARQSPKGATSIRGGIYLLGVWAVGALLLAAFPTDVPSIPISWHGAIHLVVAIFAFLGGAFGILVLSRELERIQGFQRTRKFAFPISIVAVIFFFLLLALPIASPRINNLAGGLIERILIGSVLAWMLTLSISFLVRRPPPKPLSLE
jgi:hypothetical protein